LIQAGMIKLKTIFILFMSVGQAVFAQCPWTFSVSNNTGSWTITCATSSVNLTASNNNTNAVNYSWAGPSFTANTNAVNLFNSGNYTVVATDAITSCSLSQFFSLANNTVAPTTSVSPTSFTLSCISTTASFTGYVLSPTINIQNEWYSPVNPWSPVSVDNSTTSICLNYVPGIYTLNTTNLSNGCMTQKTVDVVSITVFPTFSVTSNSNFSVGCLPTLLSFTNVQPANCSYTILPPTFTGAINPTLSLNNTTSTLISSPGTWTFIAQDGPSYCRSEIPVAVIQGTMYPAFSYTVGGAGLIWFQSTSTGTNVNTAFNWDFGDGATGAGISTSHTYSNGGVHNIILSTSNPNCYTANNPVNVNTLPCTANSGFSIAYSGTPQVWNAAPNYFGNVTNAVWSWGDGSSTNAMFPSHTYSAAGLYNICLSVTVSCANSSSSCANYNIYRTAEVTEEMTMVTVNVAPKLVTYIDENNFYNNIFSIFPNPANSTLFVTLRSSSEAKRIEILDNLGRFLKEIELQPGCEYTSINMTELAEGIYLIRLKGDQFQAVNKKLIIDR
jgi:hypothetical protein